jgi:hypothetical protein
VRRVVREQLLPANVCSSGFCGICSPAGMSIAWKMHLHDEKINSLLSELRGRGYFMLTNAKAVATATRALDFTLTVKA